MEGQGVQGGPRGRIPRYPWGIFPIAPWNIPHIPSAGAAGQPFKGRLGWLELRVLQL